MKYLSIISLCFLITIQAGAQTAESLDSAAMLKLSQNKPLDALVLIEKAIELDNKNFWYLFDKAEIDLKLEYYSDVHNDLKKAIKIAPDSSEPYNRYGAFLQTTGNRDSSLLLFNQAISHSKEESDSLIYISNRGSVYLSFMEWPEAIKDYEYILSKKPEDIGALNNISSAYKHLNQTEKAIACLQKITVLDSAFLGPYVNLGMLYTEIDSFQQAMYYYNKALKLDANDPLVLNNKGFLHYRIKEYDKAISLINKSLSLYPSNSYAYKNRAKVYFAMSKITEGCNDLDAAKYYGFEKHYGEEVNELRKEYCK
jgi:tetratricopeptide (TPR) repeat protein